MRTITTHHTNECNRSITIECDDRNPENGNASHKYAMHYLKRPPADLPSEWNSHALQQHLYFQDGPIGEVGVNGITNEVCAAIIIDRLEGFQTSKWANEYNERALAHFRAGLAELEARTREREARGVEGTHNV